MLVSFHIVYYCQVFAYSVHLRLVRFFMHPYTHVFASAIAGGVLYTLTKSERLSISCFLGGVLTDLDHLLDFLAFSKVKFSVKNFFSHYREIKMDKLLLVFHSYELYAIGLFAGYFIRNNIYLGILIGMGLHLVLDQISNRYLLDRCKSPAWFYFISYRYRFGFQKNKLLKTP